MVCASNALSFGLCRTFASPPPSPAAWDRTLPPRTEPSRCTATLGLLHLLDAIGKYRETPVRLWMYIALILGFSRHLRRRALHPHPRGVSGRGRAGGKRRGRLRPGAAPPGCRTPPVTSSTGPSRVPQPPQTQLQSQNTAGIMIRVSGVRVPPPASRLEPNSALQSRYARICSEAFRPQRTPVNAVGRIGDEWIAGVAPGPPSRRQVRASRTGGRCPTSQERGELRSRNRETCGWPGVPAARYSLYFSPSANEPSCASSSRR
jgi:hypothetical protein